MSIDSVLKMLDNHHEVEESYVLVSEVKLYLNLGDNVGDNVFLPSIRIKTYKSNVNSNFPYWFDVSHHVHTPTQAGPYHPSHRCSESEEGAIQEAITATTTFIKAAIHAGYEPSESWLIPNEDF